MKAGPLPVIRSHGGIELLKFGVTLLEYLEQIGTQALPLILGPLSEILGDSRALMGRSCEPPLGRAGVALESTTDVIAGT